jgi:FAD-linked oxidoreductase
MRTVRSSRRQFLRHAGVFGAGMAGVGTPVAQARADAAGSWRNWSGNQGAQPAAMHFPADEDELRRLLTTGRSPLRAFGASHSFSALVPSTGTMVSLERMNGLLSHDAARLQATFAAGTRIAAAGELLATIGQGLQNSPDVDIQSLAGAIATATHGTGTTLQCLSGYVRELKLVLCDGSALTCSAERERELFDAARVSLGALGIVTEITLQNRAAYSLRERTRVMDIESACAWVDARRHAARHVEFFAFAHGATALVKEMDIDPGPDTAPGEPLFDENALLEFAADTARRAPFTTGLIQRLLGAFIADGERTGPARRIFPSPRTVLFNEMEYTVPAERGIECLREVIDTIRARDIGVFFPVEFRYVAADDAWLSMFAGRAGASISVHQYHKQDPAELFAAVEPVLRRYDGRPHWGKLHTLQASALRDLYPQWEAFLAVRRRVDPHARLLNPYLRALFGV